MKTVCKAILLFSLILNFNNIIAHDLKGAVASEERTPKNMLRDSKRNPEETLSFFGIESQLSPFVK